METLPIRVEYELRYHPEPSSGLLTLSCLKNHNPVEMSEVKIWLNRTSVEDMDIRNRTDVQVVEVTLYNMTIDFTRKIEGDFSCGTATWDIQESERAAVVGKYVLHADSSSIISTVKVCLLGVSIIKSNKCNYFLIRFAKERASERFCHHKHRCNSR